MQDFPWWWWWWWRVPPHATFFFEPPSHQNQYPPWGTHPLKNEALPSEKQHPPPLKSEAPFQEMIPRKNPEKSDSVISTCVSIIKHWKRMAEIP